MTRISKEILSNNQFRTEVDDEGRVCTACHVYKKWIDYKGHSRSKTKHSSKCKGCYKVRRRSQGRQKELNPANARRSYLKANEPLVWKSRSLRSSLLARSKTSEIKSTVPSRESLEIWLENKRPFHCYYSGVALSIYDINIDHKTPTHLGGTHELDNLCISSHHMNTAKGTMTDVEFKQLLDIISTWKDGGARILTRLKIGRF